MNNFVCWLFLLAMEGFSVGVALTRLPPSSEESQGDTSSQPDRLVTPLSHHLIRLQTCHLVTLLEEAETFIKQRKTQLFGFVVGPGVRRPLLWRPCKTQYLRCTHRYPLSD